MEDSKIFRTRQYSMGCQTTYYKDTERIFKDGFTRKDYESKRKFDIEYEQELQLINEMTIANKNNYVCSWCGGEFSELINENMPCWNDIKLCTHEQGESSKYREKISGRIEDSASNRSNWKLDSGPLF